MDNIQDKIYSRVLNNFKPPLWNTIHDNVNYSIYHTHSRMVRAHFRNNPHNTTITNLKNEVNR